MSNSRWKTRVTLLGKLTLQHDETAWKDFVSYYGSYIKMVLIRTGIPEKDVEDVSQEVILKVWKSLPKYEKRSDVKFRGWLVKVIKSCAYRWHQKKIKQPLNINPDSEIEQVCESEIKAIIEEEWKLHVAELALKNVKQNFPKINIDVFEMAMGGASNQQIATKLELKENTVAVYKKRVKVALYREIVRLDFELNN